MENWQECFGTRNLLKFNFHICRGCSMLIFGRLDKAVFTFMEVV